MIQPTLPVHVTYSEDLATKRPVVVNVASSASARHSSALNWSRKVKSNNHDDYNR